MLGDQAKQAQAQFESFSASLQERMDAMQKQYEEQLASLRSQLQTAKIESAMMEREEEGPSGTNVAKQLQFQAEQIQSLKVGEMEGMGGVEGIGCQGRTGRRADVIRGEVAAPVRKKHVKLKDVC